MKHTPPKKMTLDGLARNVQRQFLDVRKEMHGVRRRNDDTPVNPDSRDFLLREYGELWTMCRDPRGKPMMSLLRAYLRFLVVWSL